MDDETAFPSVEFFTIILQSPLKNLRLPARVAKVLDGGEIREVKLREAGSRRRSWDVEVVFDAAGHAYLGRSGWKQFARAHDLQLGHFLLFDYDGDTVLTVKVFDVSMCRRHYQHDEDDDAGSGSSSDSGNDGSASAAIVATTEAVAEDGPTAQFSLMLRKCNLGAKQGQYLGVQNVPVDFQIAHGYAERSKVELRMGGKSWLVHLKHSPKTGGRPRASFRYGWHQFCVDNALDEGDTCFFRALRQGGDSHAGDDHPLKVEVRKRDGSFMV